MLRLASLARHTTVLLTRNLQQPALVVPLLRTKASYRWLCDKPAPPPPRLHMVFTCAKCETRAVKSFTKNAYEKGVVLVTCPGCNARHVIADNLGWFGEEKNIEAILQSKGQSVQVVTDNDLDYSP